METKKISQLPVADTIANTKLLGTNGAGQSVAVPTSHLNYDHWKIQRKTILYGKMYNWYTVNDPRGLINPTQTGYRVPTDIDWGALKGNLGGEIVAGGKLKETGTTHWIAPNTGASDLIGFKALPSGYRFFVDGEFMQMGLDGCWWSSHMEGPNAAWAWIIHHSNSNISTSIYGKKYGMSVRFMRDTTLPDGSAGWYFDTEGNAYKTIVFKGQEWLAENLNTKFYADGSLIPNITNNPAWAALTTGAWCYYNNNETFGTETVDDQITSKKLLELGVNHVSGLVGILAGKQSIELSYVSISAAYTLNNANDVVECTAGTFNVTLHSAVTAIKKRYSVINSGTGEITVAGEVLAQGEAVILFPNGTTWLIL